MSFRPILKASQIITGDPASLIGVQHNPVRL